MGNTSNILIGILAMVFGMVMIVWVIPAQTVPALFASVPSGFYANIGCGLMIASGAALAISGVFAGREHIDMALARRQFTVFAVALVLLSVVTLLMPHIGFIPAGIFRLSDDPAADAGAGADKAGGDMRSNACLCLGFLRTCSHPPSALRKRYANRI